MWGRRFLGGCRFHIKCGFKFNWSVDKLSTIYGAFFECTLLKVCFMLVLYCLNVIEPGRLVLVPLGRTGRLRHFC